MAITHEWANKIIDATTTRASAAAVSTLYLALSTTTPTTDKGANNWNVTEPSGNGYARVLLGAQSQSYTQEFPAASNGTTTNTKQITFNKATGDWGNCTHACLFDASSGGNLLWFGALTNAINPINGQVAIVEASNISISIS